MKPTCMCGIVLFSLITLVLVNGCGNDDPVTPPAGSGWLKITAGENSIMPDQQFGYAFTSSLDGTVLDSAAWTEPSVVKLAIPTTLGKGFYITQVYDNAGSTLYLETSAHEVAPENTLELGWPKQVRNYENAELQFLNIPPHNQSTIGSGGMGTHRTGRLSETEQIGVYVDPVDVLVTLAGLTTQRSFQWVSGVEVGSTHQVDLATLEPMPQCSVALPSTPFPSTPRELFCRIFGYRNDARGKPYLSYELDNGSIGVPAPSFWRPHLLESGFDGYIVSFRKNLATEPAKTAYLETEGGLPGPVSFSDLGIIIHDSSPDGCLVETWEEAGELTLQWGQGGYGRTLWEVTCPNDSRPFVLPQIPADLGLLFPDLDRDAFLLVWVVAESESMGLAGDGTTPMITRNRIWQFAY